MTETCQQGLGGASDLLCSSRRVKCPPDRVGRGFDEAHLGCEASRFLSTDIAVETLTFAAGFSNMAPIALTPARVRRLSWSRVCQQRDASVTTALLGARPDTPLAAGRPGFLALTRGWEALRRNDAGHHTCPAVCGWHKRTPHPPAEGQGKQCPCLCQT
jgi:hypothetical protein